jgi:hypothetical protein
MSKGKGYIVTVTHTYAVLVVASDAEHAMRRAVAVEKNGRPDAKIVATHAVKA